jgi:hypothetical protein
MPSQKIGDSEVRTFPLPPAGFDPLKATDQELQRYGFPRRPDVVKEPHKASRWVRALRNYPMFTPITPDFKEMPNHRHNLNRRVGAVGEANATSNNWSGSVLFIGGGDRFTMIAGQWTVPDAYSPNPGDGNIYYSSAWLGIDGDGSSDLMQAGTETNSNGECYAWWEWVPNASVQIPNFLVKPGDVISMILDATDSTTALVSMWNMTSKNYTNFSFVAPTTTPPTTLVGNCAEAIVERPEVGGGLTGLPRYGEVYFDECAAYTANGNQFGIGFGTPISMVDDNGRTVSVPTFEGNPQMIRCTYIGP